MFSVYFVLLLLIVTGAKGAPQGWNNVTPPHPESETVNPGVSYPDWSHPHPESGKISGIALIILSQGSVDGETGDMTYNDFFGIFLGELEISSNILEVLFREIHSLLNGNESVNDDHSWLEIRNGKFFKLKKDVELLK